jgi:hypothetical protein
VFTAYPTYSRYRALRSQLPYIHGEDVYALQTALQGVSCWVTADGIFGSATERAVTAYPSQRPALLPADGIAGPRTQERLAANLAVMSARKHHLPHGLLYGQAAHESSFILGNYSLQYKDGSWDSGVVQMNSDVYPVADAFDTPKALDTCAAHCRTAYDAFLTNPALGDARRWGLAAGAWNAPAFAHYLAGVKPWAVPTTEQKQTLEAYIESVTAYMVL